MIKTKKYEIKIYLHIIRPLFMKLLLFTFITGIDQMIFLEKHLWWTASELQRTFVWLKIEIKIYQMLQLQQAFGELFRKIYHKIKKTFKKGF